MFMDKVQALGSIEAAHDMFHKPACSCYVNIKRDCSGNPKKWAEISKRHSISHQYDCESYKFKFYNALMKGDNNLKYVELS